jgi:hypothetical protein
MLGPQPSSCRKLARELMLDKSTVWQWRQKASRGFAVTGRSTLIEPFRMGVAVVRESRKASREWVNHRRDPATHAEPDRLRWLDYPRLGLVAPDHLPRYRIPVGIAIDRAGRRAAEVLDRFAAEDCPPSRSALPATSTNPGAYQLATQGTAAVMRLGQLARGPRPTGSRPPSGLGEVWRELGAFGRFLRPFRGPATRHLPAYVAWFVTRQEGVGPADAVTPAPT